MANALKQLFIDIADAIRAKTGNTSKIVPANFPSEISNIVVGGGDSNNAEWKFASGTTTGTGSTLTITHGLGVVPDIIYVSVANTAGSTQLIGGIGFSSAFTEAFGGNGTDDERGVQFANTSSWGVTGLTLKEGVDGAHSSFSDMFGHIRNANTSTFQVGGGSITPLPSGKEITWWAVGGITG